MSETHSNARLEAFCDGVFAIALTLLIIDIKIPSTVTINNDADLWLELRNLVPSIFSFVLSFAIILISWVNHHAALKLVHKSSGAFMYANGALLLTVVFLPFPTTLLADHLFTTHAAPAVVLYSVIILVQSFAWVLLGATALRSKLTVSDHAAQTMRRNMRMGYYSAIANALFAVIALWYPLGVAIAITVVWGFWLVYGVRMRSVEE